MSNLKEEAYINHEVRIRVIEELAKDIRDKMSKMDSKMNSQFMFIIGLILTSIILPVVLHKYGLV